MQGVRPLDHGRAQPLVAVAQRLPFQGPQAPGQVPPLAGRAAGPGGGDWGGLAQRLWALERETLRHRYQRLGAAVVEWPDALHLQQVLLEVEACRRRAGLAPG